MLAKESSEALRSYVVWVPMFRGMERDVPKASAEVPDSRTHHYWDGDSLLVDGYRKTLGLPEAAWDVFLLYGAGTRWEGDTPPVPEYWMHQLGSERRPRVDGPFLQPDVLLDRTRALLAGIPGRGWYPLAFPQRPSGLAAAR